jgi:hypothetical protein
MEKIADNPLPLSPSEHEHEDRILTTRVSPAVFDVIRREAHATRRSLNSMVTVLIESALEAMGKRSPPTPPLFWEKGHKK